MASQHTPGPWFVGRLQRSSNFAKDTYAVQGDGTILCKVKGGVTEDATVAKANAHLIAAAPDLLAALKSISDMLMARPDMVAALHPMMGPAEHAVMNRAAAAIASAEGLTAPNVSDQVERSA